MGEVTGLRTRLVSGRLSLIADHVIVLPDLICMWLALAWRDGSASPRLCDIYDDLDVVAGVGLPSNHVTYFTNLFYCTVNHVDVD